MSDDTGTPAGWTIVSIADDGSVLCQSPSGHRRRYWFQVAEVDSLRAENEKLRACLAELAGAGVEYDAGKYLVVQVYHETLEEARKLLGRE